MPHRPAPDADAAPPPGAGRSLLPASWARDSVEALLAERGSGGSWIYLLVLLLVCGAFAALPFVEVPVTVRSRGVLRPAVERHEIRATVTGEVVEVRAREHQAVARGAILLRVRSSGLAGREAALRSERASVDSLIGDVQRLIRSERGLPPESLMTGRQRQGQRLRARAHDQHLARLRHLEAEAVRADALAARGLLPAADLDELRFRVDQERRTGAVLEEEARAGWEGELLELRARRNRLLAEEAVLAAERAATELRAPIGGTVERLAGLSAGSIVRVGDPIAVVSPDTTLVGVVYADGRVAALIGPGSRVRLELDAYPPSEWGVATGRVTDVAADAVAVDGRGMYEVTVALDRHHLTLPSGRRGELRKGMAFQARFTLARRSLWALLRDDIDDWLSPAPGSGPDRNRTSGSF